MAGLKELALDSSAAIAILNGDLNIAERFPSVELFYLPVTVCGELLFGARNSARPEENEDKCWKLIEACEVININLLIADEYSVIRKELKDKGRPIPENDIWIAATCRFNKLPLATADSHFLNIGDLKIVDV